MFHGKNGCDCEDKTYSNCYVLKYSEIVLPDTLNALNGTDVSPQIAPLLVHLPYLIFDIYLLNSTGLMWPSPSGVTQKLHTLINMNLNAVQNKLGPHSRNTFHNILVPNSCSDN